MCWNLSPQKLAQLGEEQLQGLHDACCLWIYLRPHLERTFQGAVVEKHLKMFWDGMLGQPVKIWVLDFSMEKLKLIGFKGFPRNPSQLLISIFPRKNPRNKQSPKKASCSQRDFPDEFVIGSPRNPSQIPGCRDNQSSSQHGCPSLYFDCSTQHI
jgi:hypothetical protein